MMLEIDERCKRIMNLITPQHKSAYKYIDLVHRTIHRLFEAEELLLKVGERVGLETTGDDLDRTAKWVGITRRVEFENLDFFSWNVPGLGWNEANWKQPNVNSNTTTLLSDNDFLPLIKLKILQNHWDGSIPQAQEILNGLGSEPIVLIDNQDMTMSLLVVGQLSKVAQSLLKFGYFDIRPAGVGIDYYYIVPEKVFAWNLNSGYYGGWNESQWAFKLDKI